MAEMNEYIFTSYLDIRLLLFANITKPPEIKLEDIYIKDDSTCKHKEDLYNK